MAVVKVLEQRTRWGGRSLSSGRQYRRVFKVVTNDPRDGPAIVYASLGLSYGDHYKSGNEEDPFAFITDVDCSEIEDDGVTWLVTINYSWLDNLTFGGGANNIPTESPIEVNWGYKTIEKVAEWAYPPPDAEKQDPIPVLNTAGEPFDPPLTYEQLNPVLTVVRNEALGFYNPSVCRQYRNATNKDQFAGEDPGLWRVVQPGVGQRMFNQDIGVYYRVTYEFELNPDGWLKRVPSLGMRQLSTDGTKLEQIIVQGAPIGNPALLDKKGRAIAPGSDPYIQEFQIYNLKNFADFGFDEDILQAKR